MAESFVTRIAGGDTLEQKISVTLNRAGDSPHNPILKGLGMTLAMKLAPNVSSYEAYVGRETPAAEKLLTDYDQIGLNYFSIDGAAGEGQLGLDVDYSSAVRQFLRLVMRSASHEIGQEWQFWVEQDPLIELFYCGAGLAWCCDAMQSYYNIDGDFGLRTDPGEPPLEPTDPVTPAGTTGTFTDPATTWAASAGLFKEEPNAASAAKTVSINGIGTYDVGTDTFTSSFSFEFEAYHPTTLRPVRVSGLGQTFSGSGSRDPETGEFSGTGTIQFSFTPTWEYIDDGTPGSGVAFINDTSGTFISESATYDGTKFCSGPEPGSTALANSSVVEVGPDKIVTMYVNSIVVNADNPLDLPMRLMNNWKDEFDQKHYGGAAYVSIFEEGYTEDTQGSYVVNVYQADITSVTSLRIINVDADHEYRVVLRFRSGLDDVNYVDKLVRFRLLNTESLRSDFGDALALSNFPTPTYDGTDWTWSGMTAFVASHGILGAQVVVGEDAIALPLDDVTPFDSNWLSIRALSYGGEVVVRFTRDYTESNFALEQTRCTYLVDNAQTFTKVMFRRDIGSKSQSFAPDVQFRVIQPEGESGAVYLEPLVNQIDYKQVVVWTELGSIKLPMPLQSGQRHNISDIVALGAGASGGIQQDRIMVALQTLNTLRVLELEPMSIRPYTQHGNGQVEPEFVVDWPHIDVTWPATMVDGQDYEVAGTEDIATTPTYILWGPKGFLRVLGVLKGSEVRLTNAADQIMYAESARFFAHYRTFETSGFNPYDYVVEYPSRIATQTVPTDGIVDNDNIGLIYYDNKIVLTKRPPNLTSVVVTGSGGTRTIYSSELLEYAWIDVTEYTRSDGSVTVSYTTYDPDTGINVSSGNFIVAEYIPLPLNQVIETTNNPAIWETSRLLETELRLPKARIDDQSGTIEFDYEDRFVETVQWVRFSVANPLDRQILSFAITAPNRKEIDIARLFRDDNTFAIQRGQSLAVTFVHRDGPHVTALYKVNDEWVEPVQLNNLRGLL